MVYLLTILGLGLGVSQTEIRLHYWQLACRYHPDKNDLAITGLNATEASDFFKRMHIRVLFFKQWQEGLRISFSSMEYRYGWAR